MKSHGSISLLLSSATQGLLPLKKGCAKGQGQGDGDIGHQSFITFHVAHVDRLADRPSLAFSIFLSRVQTASPIINAFSFNPSIMLDLHLYAGGYSQLPLSATGRVFTLSPGLVDVTVQSQGWSPRASVRNSGHN